MSRIQALLDEQEKQYIHTHAFIEKMAQFDGCSTEEAGALFESFNRQAKHKKQTDKIPFLYQKDGPHTFQRFTNNYYIHSAKLMNCDTDVFIVGATASYWLYEDKYFHIIEALKFVRANGFDIGVPEQSLHDFYRGRTEFTINEVALLLNDVRLSSETYNDTYWQSPSKQITETLQKLQANHASIMAIDQRLHPRITTIPVNENKTVFSKQVWQEWCYQNDYAWKVPNDSNKTATKITQMKDAQQLSISKSKTPQQKGAEKRHEENRGMKNDVFLWCEHHLNEHPSQAQAVKALVELKLVPVAD